MNIVCDVCFFYEISLLTGGIKIHFSGTYNYLIYMQQCAVAEPILKSMWLLKEKEPPVFYFNQQVFSPVYLSINDIPNSKSEIL